MNYEVKIKFTEEAGNAFLSLHKNNDTIPNDKFVDLKKTPEEPQKVPAFTNAEWIQEYFLRQANGQVVRAKNVNRDKGLPVLEGNVTKI